MKRFLKASFMAVATLVVTFFAIFWLHSCTKNDDNKDSLVGANRPASVGGVTATFEFTTGTACKLTESYQGESMSTTGTYVYNTPNISLSFPQEELNFSGTINGNKMTITEEGESIIFTKNRQVINISDI